MTNYTPATLSYHVIIPFLQGYAFSSPPSLDRDFRLENVARIMNNLMIQLGFGAGYVVQGGDFGSKVARALGGVHPEAKCWSNRMSSKFDCADSAQLFIVSRIGI
jgi:microsomal epoxide hydrolase